MQRLLIGLFATVLATNLAAATDYERMRKDASIMSSIVRGAFDAERPCEHCSIRIDGKYLARQGMVFTVRSPSYAIESPGIFSINTSSLDDSHILTGIEHIPEFVQGIIEDIDIDIDHDFGDVRRRIRIINDDDMDKIRESRRYRRNLEEEVREFEIELIHANETEKASLTDRIAALEKKVEDVRSREAELEQRIQRDRDVAQQEEDERQRIREEKKQAHQSKVEGLVLSAFCDYGTTLKALNRDDHVTIIFEQERDADQILVFDRDRITDCKDNDLRQHATSYTF
jgi:hypothetical protein